MCAFKTFWRFSDIREQLRQELLAAAVQQAVDDARNSLAVHRFNLDGTDLDTGPRLNMGGSSTPR